MFRQDLANLAIFDGLTADQISMIDSLLETVNFEIDALIFQQDHSADYLYILLNGEVEIGYKPYDAPRLTVTTIQPGGIFGWSAAMGRLVYTSSAQAKTACQVYRLNSGQMRDLCNASPETGQLLLYRLAGVIAQRVSNTHSQVLAIISQGMNLEDR